MRNNYFDYLCGLIEHSENYIQLFLTLDDIEFHPLVPNDDNRAEDGKQLRYDFMDFMEYTHIEDVENHNKECSMLEMMIALSKRLIFETAESRWEKTISEWFWILIDNLGLKFADDDAFMVPVTRHQVMFKINRLLFRDYMDDGDGGLFPLNHPQHDQRKTEIWYQMTEYIMENYPM